MDSSLLYTFIIVFGACFVASGLVMGFWVAILNSMLHVAKDIYLKSLEAKNTNLTDKSR